MDDSLIITEGKLNEEENILTLDERIIDETLLGSYEKVRCRVNGELYFLKYDLFKGGPSRHYSDDKASVSEAFASAVVQNSDIKDRMRCAEYRLVKVRIKDQEYSASLSRPFLGEDETEMFLSTNYSTNCLLSLQDYLNIIDWADTGDKIVDAYATRMPREEARSYVLNLSAFDLLCQNADRVGNAYNTSIAAKGDRIEPINMDFGKCFGLKAYTKTTEEILKESASEEDPGDLYDETFIPQGQAFFTYEEIKSSEFEPFRVDYKGLQNAFKKICRDSENTDHEIYARIQASCIEKLLNKAKYKGVLWIEK